MATVQRAAEVRGKTMHWAWTEGPTEGKTYEHVFHEDGTVEYRDADAPRHPGSANAPAKASDEPKVEYGAMKVADDVYIVSYLSSRGFTLTVALNFDDHTMAGFASGANEWHPLRGTFEVVD